MSKSHDKSGADLPGLGADFAGHWFWDLCKSGLKTTTHDLGFTRQLTHKYGVKLPTHDLVCSSVSPGHEQNSTDILVVAVNFSRCSRNFDWCCDGTSITGLIHRNPRNWFANGGKRGWPTGFHVQSQWLWYSTRNRCLEGLVVFVFWTLYQLGSNLVCSNYLYKVIKIQQLYFWQEMQLAGTRVPVATPARTPSCPPQIHGGCSGPEDETIPADLGEQTKQDPRWST